MPTALELLDQHSKHIDKLNVDIANLHKTITELNMVIDEQVREITFIRNSLSIKDESIEFLKEQNSKLKEQLNTK
jgi:uncharacterized coiled-coil protein SlyX